MSNHVIGTGISANRRAFDLSDFGAELDDLQKLGVETIEIPTFDMDLVVGGRIRAPQLAALKRATAGRKIVYSVHGPLAVNFFDAPYRLQRHFDVLKASMEVAAEIGAINYVMHSGIKLVGQNPGTEDAYARQREWLGKVGELARDLNLYVCVENVFCEFDNTTYTASPSRLAREIAAVAHPHVWATLDFSHGYLNTIFVGGDFESECVQLAPYAKHLHMHDSFGLPDDIWMYTEGERLAFGHGDLHLPVGWGNIPWASLMQNCRFPNGTIFNIELQLRYWYAARECVDATKALARKALPVMGGAAA